jgi:hypothetical protein
MLATTYLDWMYSEEGSEWTTGGLRVKSWEKNEKGEKQLDPVGADHEMGTALAAGLLDLHELADAGHTEVDEKLRLSWGRTLC